MPPVHFLSHNPHHHDTPFDSLPLPVALLYLKMSAAMENQKTAGELSFLRGSSRSRLSSNDDARSKSNALSRSSIVRTIALQPPFPSDCALPALRSLPNRVWNIQKKRGARAGEGAGTAARVPFFLQLRRVRREVSGSKLIVRSLSRKRFGRGGFKSPFKS